PGTVDTERLRFAHADREVLRIRIYNVHTAMEAAEHRDGARPRRGVDVRARGGLPQHAPCRHVVARSEEEVEIQNDLLSRCQSQFPSNRYLLQFRIRDHLDGGRVEAGFTE